MSTGSIFNFADWVAIILFFVGMLVIVWASVRKKAKDGEGYFLSARYAKWGTIGTSIFTSNIGSEHLVGLAGAGFATGMAMAHWEMHAWLILVLGWVFVPIYDRIKVFTMPEFLELRYSRGSRSVLSFLTIASLVLTKLSATLYAADVVFKVFLGFDSISIFGHQVDMFWVISLGLAIVTGIYTAIGGMRVIMYTAVLQTPVLLLGSFFILLIGLTKLGGGNMIAGWQSMVATVGDNIHLVRPLTDKEFPWLAVLPGSAMIGFWYWCTDQYIVQRVLAGKNEKESRRGTILAAYLKLTPVFIFMIPGMVALALTKMADSGFMTNGDEAYTSLVAQLLPHGIRGIVACGMLASLMASLASKFNASAALFTMDFYQKWHPEATGRTQVIVGRIATGVIVLIGILWIPVMKTLGKNLYEYLQSVQGYMSPAIVVLFAAGIFWKRATAPAAFWSFIIGAFGGFLRLGLDLLIDRPLKEGIATVEAMQAQYGFLFSLQQIHWLYYAEGLLIVSALLLVVISLLTKPPAKEKEQYTAAGATPEQKIASRASWNKWDVIHTCVVMGVIVWFYVSFW
jgi:SSS family solute:Na+ symporter